jgi:hypothetical protein
MCPAPSSATLFLYPESGGFSVGDFGGFPSPDVVQQHFEKVAVIANRSAPNWKDHWTDPHVKDLIEKSKVPLEKWLAYYMSKDGLYCACNSSCEVDGQPGPPTVACCGGPNNVDKATVKSYAQCCWDGGDCNKSVVDAMVEEVNAKDVKGILFDYENVGDPTFIVDAFNKVREKVPGLQLAWTKDLGATKMTSPGNKSPNSPWDFSLGQAYTGTNTDHTLYDFGHCGFANKQLAQQFWTQLGIIFGSVADKDKAFADRAVPMVCGAGNCQEIPQGKDVPEGTCTDERLSGLQIDTLLKARPQNFPFRNFAIWYGTFTSWSNPYSYNDITYFCHNSNSACANACCTDWKGKEKP